MDQTTSNMIKFFREVADDLDNHRLTHHQIFELGQFYMKYEYEHDTEDISESDTYKYMFTGWYIHQQMANMENQNPQAED